jgi:hypothetical protein
MHGCIAYIHEYDFVWSTAHGARNTGLALTPNGGEEFLGDMRDLKQVGRNVKSMETYIQGSRNSY